MKNKKLVFLLLVLGIVFISGCTTSGSGKTTVSSGGLINGVVMWTKNVFAIIIGIPFIAKFVSVTSITDTQAFMLLTAAFLASWTIVYGFLSQLSIFGRRKNLLYIFLSFLISVMGSITGLVPWLSLFLFTSMNIWAIVIFALMFFVGTWFLYKKRSAEWGTAASVAGAYHEDIKGLKGELADKRLEIIELRKKIAKTANPDTRVKLEEREQKVKDELTSLKDRIQELAESYRS